MPDKVFTLTDVEVKEAADGLGTFTGYLSVYGNVDSQGEVVDKGAFKRSLAHQSESGEPLPLLWNHDRESPPIGTLFLSEDDHGLKVNGTLLLGIERAREVYEGMKAGVVRGLSIGFRTLRDRWEKTTRHLVELMLLEGSATTWPANKLARVEVVKGDKAAGAEVQSVVFPKEHWGSAKECAAWLREHDFAAEKADETDSSYRYRQAEPSGFSRFSMVCLLPNKGPLDKSCKVKAVLGVPKGKADGVADDAELLAGDVEAWALTGEPMDAEEAARLGKAAVRIARGVALAGGQKNAANAFGAVLDVARSIREAVGAAVVEEEARRELWSALDEVRSVVEAIMAVLYSVAKPEYVVQGMSAAVEAAGKDDGLDARVKSKLGALAALLTDARDESRSADPPDRHAAPELPTSYVEEFGRLKEYLAGRPA